MTFLFYMYLGVRKKKRRVLVCMWLNLDSSWFQNGKEKASSLAPLNYLGFYTMAENIAQRLLK